MLKSGGFGSAPRPKEVERFEARDVRELVDSLDDYLRTIENDQSLLAKSEGDREGVVSVLLAVEEASLMIYDDLQRILVFPQSDGSVRLEGFVPTKSLGALRGRMGLFLVAAEAERPSANGRGEPYVPSLLVNPRIVRIFESLTLMRGLPRYGEVDPTPILAFVFPLFFGLMFGDVGHGIVLFAFGLYLIYKTAYAPWGNQVLVLSASTIVIGVVRGSFFGLSFTSPLASVVSLPPAFTASFTLSYIPFLLELAIVIGTFHLASGYAIAFVNDERAGNLAKAYLNRLPTVLIYASIVPLGFAIAGTNLDLGALLSSTAPTPVFNELLGLQIPVADTAKLSLPFVVASSLVLVLGQPADEYAETRRARASLKELGTGVVDAAAKLFEFFTNTLSYVRLGVLLVTTNLLETLTADIIRSGPIGIAIGAFLNVCVIGLEGLIVYIQDMRLQLYEWFSEFYAGTGIPFVPMVSKGPHFSISWA